MAVVVLQHSRMWRSTGAAGVAVPAALARVGFFFKIRRRSGAGNAINVSLGGARNATPKTNCEAGFAQGALASSSRAVTGLNLGRMVYAGVALQVTLASPAATRKMEKSFLAAVGLANLTGHVLSVKPSTASPT